MHTNCRNSTRKRNAVCLLILSCSLVLNKPSFAQTPGSNQAKNTVHHYRNWFAYTGQFKVCPKWGIHAEAQFRMDDAVKFATQNLLRGGLIRYLNAHSNVTAGYVYTTNYDGNFKEYSTEQRIWEQFNYLHTPAKISLTYHVRLEQRWAEQLKKKETNEVVSDGYRYGNRLRLYVRAVYDLDRKPETKTVPYLALQEEVFFNFGAPGINKNFFDQNRFYFGIGLNYQKHTRLEVGYLNQYTNPYNRARNMNHTAQFSITQTLNFGKDPVSQ